jgi:flagellar biosynthesis anti-sigma factor FlgM
MRIDLTQAAASHVSSEPNAEQVKARQANETVPSQHEDRATLSTQTLSSLVETAMNSPEVRQEKVDNLKSAISSGKYQLDPAEIAKSMIDEHA